MNATELYRVALLISKQISEVELQNKEEVDKLLALVAQILNLKWVL